MQLEKFKSKAYYKCGSIYDRGEMIYQAEICKQICTLTAQRDRLVEVVRELITWYGHRDNDSTLLPTVKQPPEIATAMIALTEIKDAPHVE
jgi:hypothetical protein